MHFSNLNIVQVNPDLSLVKPSGQDPHFLTMSAQMECCRLT